MKKILVLFILTLCVTGIYAVNTYTYVGTTGNYQLTDWNVGGGERTINLPKYAGNGTLMEATLTLEFHINQDIGVENTASTSTMIVFTGRCISFWNHVPGYSANTPYFTAETSTGPQNYLAYDGVTDFAGLSGKTFSNQSGSIVYSPIVYGGGDLNQFLGSGNFDLDVWTLTGYAVSGGAANVEAQVVTEAYAKATVQYVVDETLPIELASFSAIQTRNNYASLNWRTQSESNMRGYYILKSTEDNIETSVNITADKMIPSTNSSVLRSYLHIDEDVDYGVTYYYWLESVDYSGGVAIYEPTSITMIAPAEGTTEVPVNGTNILEPIYPNPFNPTANIRYELAVAGDVTIEVFNVMGQKVASWSEGTREAGVKYQSTWKGNSDKDVVLSSGVYFFKLSSRGTHQIQRAIMLK